MANFRNVICRVLWSYSIEEKIISLVLVIISVVAAINGFMDFFKSNNPLENQSGYYSEGILSERPAIINPLYTDYSDANRDLSALIFSGLTRYDSKLKAFVGDLADLTIMEDKKTYLFKIKPNVYWHDYETLTADDVLFTFVDIIQNPDFQNPVLKANFDGVEIVKMDDYTIKFILNNPNSFFITNLNVGILPKHILSKNINVAELPYSSFNVKPVGTGPYMINDAMEIFPDGRQRIILKKFDRYYAESSKIKNIRFTVYPDAESMLKERNVLDVVSKVPKSILADINKESRFVLDTYRIPQYSAVFFNMDTPVLKNFKLRLALQKAIDKDALLKLIDNKERIDTPLLELNQKDWLIKPNLEEAKGALFDSGYKIDSVEKNIYRKDRDGIDLKLNLLVRAYDLGSVQADETTKIVGFLLESWKKMGLRIEINYQPVDIFNSMLENRKYDLVLTGQSLGYNLDTYSYWHSSQANVNGLNVSNYKSFAADSFIERIRSTFDQRQKENLVNQLSSVLSNDIPAIFLYRPLYIYADNNKVKGVNFEGWVYPADRFGNIKDWCIDC